MSIPQSIPSLGGFSQLAILSTAFRRPGSYYSVPSSVPLLSNGAGQGNTGELWGLRMASVPVKERVKVSQNWRLGRCREGILLKWRCSQMPWMQLEGDSLYISQANFILAYQFRPDGASLNRRPLGVFAGHDEDVCHFVLANSHIISAGGDGKIGVHKIHSTFTVKYSAHEQEVNCVDCRGGIIVSGSRDRTAKVWPLASGRLGQCLHTIQTEDRVWSIAISPVLSFTSKQVSSAS
ncbi:hypothetical protein GH733_001093 [Mirounga leonina]|nr:hypothetical protein GH733_001093 [Mirounga leonina]